MKQCPTCASYLLSHLLRLCVIATMGPVRLKVHETGPHCKTRSTGKETLCNPLTECNLFNIF